MKKMKLKLFIMSLFCMVLIVHAVPGYAEQPASLQGITVSGTVIDSSGEPMPGVNVTVRGTTTGVITDINGNYTITVPNRESVLAFSYIGYVTTDVVVGNQTNISLTLSEDTKMIEEVVVIGYGTVRKSDLTGSIVSLSSEKFRNLPQGGVTSILQGKAAGVNITSLSGAGHSNIRIRGTTSINKSSEPLWVVDGVIGGSTPHVLEIQSIEVLKDASATAIYGSQGANGVILVTTKRPQEGKARVTFDTRFSVNTLRKKLDMLTPYEYATAYMDFDQGMISDEDMAAYKAGTKGTNWYDEMTQTGYGQSYSLIVSGGSHRTKYRVIASAGDNQSQWVTRNSRSYSFRTDLDVEIAPWLSLTTYMVGSASNSHNEETGLSTFEAMLQMTPCMEIQDEDGVFNRDPFFTFLVNPMASVKGQYTDRERNNLSGFVDLKFKLPLEGLTLSVQGLYAQGNAVDRTFRSAKREPGANSSAENGWSKSYSIRNINNLTYQNQFGDHRVTASAILELYTRQSSSLSLRAENLMEEGLEHWNLRGADSWSIGQGYNNGAMVSAIGRIVYSYKGKYLLTGTWRADAPSQFRDEYKWGYFPSLGIGWNMAEEDFMPKDLIQQLKIRASVGVSGNHSVQDYATLSALELRNATYAGSTEMFGYWPGNPINRDIRWESTLQYNLGFDLGIWDRKANLTVDWYKKETRDLLWEKPVPLLFGGGTVWINEGMLENNGWEFTANVDPFRNRDFAWETTLTASYSLNKVKDLAGLDEIIPDPGSSRRQSMFIMRPGLPLGTFYTHDWVGFDERGANLYRTADGGTTLSPVSADKFVTGYSIPKWTYGWNNQFSYKNWDLNIFFRFTGKFDRLNLTRYYSSGKAANSFITLREAYYQNWDKVADKSNAKYGSYSNPLTNSYTTSSQWLEQGQFLRLQNLTLGYNIPKKTAYFANIYLSLTCQNLFVLSGYSGMDPETVSSGSGNDQTLGRDEGAFPLPRSFNITARFDF